MVKMVQMVSICMVLLFSVATAKPLEELLEDARGMIYLDIVLIAKLMTKMTK